MNGIYSMFSWIIPLVLGLVITPVVVNQLGKESYGLYSVILGFISYSFSIGIGKTASKYVAEYRAANESEKLADTLSSILWISLAFGLISTAIIFLTAKYLVINVLLITPEFQETAVTAMYFAGLTILITMISQIFQFVLQGLQRFDRFLLLTNVNVLLLNLGSLALVYSGFGVLALIIWNCIVVVVLGILFYWNAIRLLPEFSLRYKIKSDIWNPALKYAFSIVVYQSFGNVLLLFERGWLVRKFGTASLTYYIVPMSLGFYFHGLVSSVSLVMFPVVNEFLASKETLVRIYKTSTKLILTMTVFFIVSSIFEGQLFLGVWMKGDFAINSYTILVIHAFTFGILGVVTVAWQMVESFGRAKLNAFATVAWLLISIPLMVVFANEWQTPGVALGRLIGVMALLPLIIYVERKFLGGISVRFWLTTSMRVLIAGVFAGLCEWLINQALPPSWIGFVISSLVGVIVYVLILIIAGFFESEEKTALKTLIFKQRQN